MDFQAVIRVALRALARNKMRTALTMLGIIIGVGAVICTVAIGEGASNQVQEQLRNLGDNLVFISAGNRTRGGVRMGAEATKTLTVADARAIEQQCPMVSRVSPGVWARGQVVFGNQNWNTSVRGVTPEYLEIRRWPLLSGGVFSQRDVDSAANVCLIGQTVVENLFPDDDPLGKTIRITNIPFRIVGVLASKGQSPFGRDEDDMILMPFTTVQKKIAGIDWVNFIMCSAVSPEAIHAAQQDIAGLLRQRHKLREDEEDDFIVRSPTDLATVQAQAGRIMTLLLASIASVSLLVGGIGIMNIMLVSVTERTREIGVRMAVGATEQDVQRQFLSEALVLSLLGGAVGVAAGVGGSMAVSSMLQWPTSIPPQAIAIAVFFSAGVGVFFGYYPARKAARLDPIEALRYE
ncbi:MAG: ABC transporter permease [Acidobacteria bacterium]|nr:ABC transporter permease [Acidobacteriota bacterium]MBI1983013.1 ABC transporter permease [Acidobacteriota bacterium]